MINEEVRDGRANVDSRDNRALVDNNTAQSLTGEDIEAMRRWVHLPLVEFWFLVLLDFGDSNEMYGEDF